MQQRPINAIARDVENYWPKVNYAARPYLDAMHHLSLISDKYYADSAKSVINYFLANASAFKGEHAKRIKTELKELVKLV